MSPIILKDFTWRQNETTVTIVVTADLNPKNTDIYTSPSYIKVHCPPYIFELFLYKEIDDDKSRCTILDKEVIFQLIKKDQVEWPQLVSDIDRSEKETRRQEIIESLHENEKRLKTARREQLHNLQQQAVKEQINFDSANRQKAEELKNIERKNLDTSLKVFKLKNENCPKSADHRKVKCDTKNANSFTNDFPVPLPRQTANIKVRFTERQFPTPQRESMMEEEQTWLKKQLAARRAAGFVAEDLRPEECDPVWLKNKGDTFHSQQNYLGAISAYSHAIKIGSTMPALFTNRAASHLAIGNLHKALEDCSQALELLTPHVESNAEARARCHARRGFILCGLGVPEKSIADFKEAMKLRPDDIELRCDYEKALAMIEEQQDSD